MSAGIILAIGIAIATALMVALIAARRAGDTLGPEADYGRELDTPAGARFGRGARPGVRQRAMLAVIAAALAAFGAGLATYLSHGPQ
jgi:hypothetical protein